jgi:hypothetical protein
MRTPIQNFATRNNSNFGPRPARDISTNPMPALSASQTALATQLPGVSTGVIAAIDDTTITSLMALAADRFAAFSQLVVAMAANGIWPSDPIQRVSLLATMAALGTSTTSAAATTVASTTTQADALAASVAFFCVPGSAAVGWCAANGVAVPPATATTTPVDTSCPIPSAQQQALLYKDALNWNAAHPSCPVPLDTMCATPPTNLGHDDAVAWNATHPQCPVTVPGNGVMLSFLLGVGATVVIALLAIELDTGSTSSTSRTTRRTTQQQSVRLNPRRSRRRRNHYGS